MATSTSGVSPRKAPHVKINKDKNINVFNITASRYVVNVKYWGKSYRVAGSFGSREAALNAGRQYLRSKHDRL